MDALGMPLPEISRGSPCGRATENTDPEGAVSKAMFFRMKAADGNVIDYTAAIGGSLFLIPNGADLDALRKDYQSMIEEGLLREDAYDFNELIAQCTSLQKEANKGIAI